MRKWGWGGRSWWSRNGKKLGKVGEAGENAGRKKKKRKSLEEIGKGWIEGMLTELKGQQGMLRSSREERATTSRRHLLLEEGVAGDGVAKGGISWREELW